MWNRVSEWLQGIQRFAAKLAHSPASATAATGMGRVARLAIPKTHLIFLPKCALVASGLRLSFLLAGMGRPLIVRIIEVMWLTRRTVLPWRVQPALAPILSEFRRLCTRLCGIPGRSTIQSI